MVETLLCRRLVINRNRNTMIVLINCSTTSGHARTPAREARCEIFHFDGATDDLLLGIELGHV